MNFDIRSLPLRDLIIGGILFLVVGNLVYLDFRITEKIATQSTIPAIVQNTTQSNIPQPTSVSSNPDCATCPAQLNVAMSLIKNIQAALTVTPTLTPIPTSTPTPNPAATVSGSLIKEYFIPMSTGYSSAGDWADVPGVKANLDTTLYPPIKQVTLEFTGYTPTGNQVVYARLYNDTDSHAIPGSDITWSGGGYQAFTTPALTLDSGNKTYSVQIKTQLQYTSYIQDARLHIVLY